MDRWATAGSAAASSAIREALASYRYNDAASAAYEYFWNDLCDWYLEATKLSFRSDDP